MGAATQKRLGKKGGNKSKLLYMCCFVIALLIINNTKKNMFITITIVSNNFKSYISSYQEKHAMSEDDGCGIINDRNSSTWVELKQSEIDDANELQVCLRRIGQTGYATEIGSIGLNCSRYISFDILRSTLSQYETVWLHGDSIMEQVFYTLACMMNSSVTVPHPNEKGVHDKVGLAEQGNLMERFIYSHANGKTEFMYSRFGLLWHKQDNLYKYDFPFAVRTLTSKDIILTTGAAVHYEARAGTEFEKALDFISTQSILANASIYLIEPTPEEWPTTNGMFTTSCMWFCECEQLTNKRLIGRGQFTQPPENTTYDEEYSMVRGKPEVDFFKRLYPNMDSSWLAINTEKCIPNCMPNTWRIDLLRKYFVENTTNKNDVHLVPIYWQLVSIPEGNTGRGKGDCTHRNLYGTELILFQWIRTILGTK